MNPKTLLFSVVLVLGVLATRAARMFILDDGEFYHHRVRRDLPVHSAAPRYDPLPPVDLVPEGSDSYHTSHYKKGIVGPVYTFVKTDPYAHVKWGVRHVAGKKYAGHRR